MAVNDDEVEIAPVARQPGKRAWVRVGQITLVWPAGAHVLHVLYDDRRSRDGIVDACEIDAWRFSNNRLVVGAEGKHGLAVQWIKLSGVSRRYFQCSVYGHYEATAALIRTGISLAPRLKTWLRRHRVETTRLAPPIRRIQAMVQNQESGDVGTAT